MEAFMYQNEIDALFATEVTGVPQQEPVEKTPEVPHNDLSCKDCGKAYKYKSSLREHMRHHTGEMPFQCPHPGCNFRFKWRSSLSNHRRYHREDEAVTKPAAKKTASKSAEKKTVRSRRAAQKPAPKMEIEIPAPASPVSSAAISPVSTGPLLELNEFLDISGFDNFWGDIKFDTNWETSEASDIPSEPLSGFSF